MRNADGRRFNTEAALAEFVGSAEYAVVGVERVGEQVIAACPNLEIIAKYGVGVDNLDQAALEVAIEAINEGAIARFFTKPCDPVDLAFTIRQALQHRDLLTEAKRLLHLSKRQTAIMAQLERNNPGITEVHRDPDGTVMLEPPPSSHDEILQEIGRQVDRAERNLKIASPNDGV